MPSGLFHFKLFGPVLFQYQGVWLVFIMTMFYRNPELNANNVVPDQMPHLIWVYTVWQCPFYGTPDLNGLNSENTKQTKQKYLILKHLTIHRMKPDIYKNIYIDKYVRTIFAFLCKLKYMERRRVGKKAFRECVSFDCTTEPKMCNGFLLQHNLFILTTTSFKCKQ